MKIIFDNVVIGSSHYLLSLVGLGNHDGLIFSLQNLFNNVKNLDECLVHESGGWVTILCTGLKSGQDFISGNVS